MYLNEDALKSFTGHWLTLLCNKNMYLWIHISYEYEKFKLFLFHERKIVVAVRLQPHGLQLARCACSSPSPGVYTNSCPSSRWCHPTISSSVIPFSSCLQSFPASGSFPMSQFFESGGQSIGASVSASVFPTEYSGLISFRTDWLDLLAFQGTLKSLLQHHSLKTSILWYPAFLIVQLSDYYQNFFWIELSLQLVSHNCSNNVTISYMLMLKLLNVTNKLLIGNASFNDNRVFLPISLYFHGWM